MDGESAVSADPRRGQIPGGKLGPDSVLPARHLFFLEAVTVLLLTDETSCAPAPVALFFLSILALLFRRPTCVCGGRRAGGRPALGFGVRVCAEALQIPQLVPLLDGQLKLSQWFERDIWSCFRSFLWSRFNKRCLGSQDDFARFRHWWRGLACGGRLTGQAWLWNGKRHRLILSGLQYLRFRCRIWKSARVQWFLEVSFGLMNNLIRFFLVI